MGKYSIGMFGYLSLSAAMRRHRRELDIRRSIDGRDYVFLPAERGSSIHAAILRLLQLRVMGASQRVYNEYTEISLLQVFSSRLAARMPIFSFYSFRFCF